MTFQPAQVESYSGYKASERPLAFCIGAQRFAVAEVLARWQEAARDPTQQCLGIALLPLNRSLDWRFARRALNLTVP